MKDDKISITFVGENAEDVTGSCILVQTPHVQILLECGLWQSTNDVFETYRVNNRNFEFKPCKLSYVFVNHCHIDHSGLVPLLYKRGCKAKIIIPEGNTPILDLLLHDSAKIAACDAKAISTRFSRKYDPIYNNDDVDNSLRHTQEYPFNNHFVLDDHVSFRFSSSSHILNSAQLELWIKEGNITKKILYTSDLGNTHIQSDYTSPFSSVGKADIVIGESTYGKEERIAKGKEREKDKKKIEEIIRQKCIEEKGKVLIPVFANQRGQQMLTCLFDIFSEDPDFNIPIIFDTPLGINICKAFSKVLKGKDAEKWEKVINWDRIIFSAEATESSLWMKSNRPAIILSSSGFLASGRARGWTAALLSCEKNAIIFCGFAVEHSLASIIKAKTHKSIKINKMLIVNKCTVADLHSFTSHMQQDSLVMYYSGISCQKIYLVHGTKASKDRLAELTRKAIEKRGGTAKVVVAEKGAKLVLSGKGTWIPVPSTKRGAQLDQRKEG